MNFINDIIDKITGGINSVVELIKEKKKIAIIIGAVILLFIVLKVVGSVKSNIESKSPIKEIDASCDTEFDTSTPFDENLDAFTLTAIRENGNKTDIEITSDNIKLSQNFVNPYGKTTPVKVSYMDGEKEYDCQMEVPNKRDKIVGFQCGYPNAADVVGVLYSNGEFCYEGEGDVLVWNEEEYPWLTEWWADKGIEAESVPQIKSVTFDDGVRPTSLNYAFENCTSLVYVDKIPSSIRTMIRTFAGCTSLKNAADVTGDDALLNMRGAYSGCSSLVNANIIPENVRVTKETFKDCTDLQVCADMSGSEKITIIDSMYENCQKLASCTLKDGIVSMRSTFLGCINLKQISDFPSTVKYMENTFSGDVSLNNFAYTIPDTVKTLTGCFSNCQVLSGEIYIDCNVDQFEEMFLGACEATKVNLLGNSMLLDAYANTNDTDNVYVNSIRPNSKINSYNDIFQ